MERRTLSATAVARFVVILDQAVIDVGCGRTVTFVVALARCASSGADWEA
jgi:hypothetical protein